jgi:DNA-binding transcriptional ArsR family regulator
MGTPPISHAPPAMAPHADGGVELRPLFAEVAKYFGLLSDPTRLRILHTICRSERHVGAIVATVGVSQTNVSRHLAVLRGAGVVTRRKVRNTVFYKVADPVLTEVCRTISAQIANRLESCALPCEGPAAQVSPH